MMTTHRRFRFRRIRMHPLRRKHLRRVLIFKTVVMVGLLAGYFLPASHAIAATVAANLLWLWKG